MEFNKRSLGIFGASIFFIFIVCWCFFFKMISPGYVGVVVDLFGDSKGVGTKELHVGVHRICPFMTVYQFPIFEQNHTWEGKEAFSFQTSEGLAISADIGITFHIRPNSIPNIFAKYRRGMEEITHIFIRNYIRDAINKSASKMKIEDLYGESKEMFFEQVQNQVREELRGVGFELSRIYLIGKFHFPETVVAALNQKIEAIQRAQQRENELREAEAEAKKQIAKASGQAQCVLLQAESEAKANLLLSQSVTAELIQWQAVQKWDGKLPSVTSGATPFIQVK
ncbi:MAG: prohibitin family protein [Parachlamydiaceae bacterium]|nr:prohibitin family protein [Parachlamydiaceae bacterium]